MAKEKLVPIKEADLTNNCPECFNQELKLTFYQKHTYGKLFHRTTNKVINQIVCKKCSSMIYPAMWTDDIERIFEYYRKMAQPENASLRFTSLFYVLLLVLLSLVAAGVYIFIHGIPA